ncbi:hypothetical protein JCGZ_05780 [Jatropha curcas]|uniref:Exostosin GT47 domain-containing protein n=1 Tax=Jatropha curcas TaxID=180498 RepID=A0A067KSC1_JATCU|nr:hypothetical protein JCGZ_05780 [Jatropha curcas]
MCPYLANSGFGVHVTDKNLGLQDSWYATNQFLLEVIFRTRMEKYDCLTNDSSSASAIFVPYYAGLDVGRYLWDYNVSFKDALGVDVAKWLSEQPEWKRMTGRDHFFVAGRIAFDFRRNINNENGWGNKFMSLPESMNMTMLTIETMSWTNEFAIPYPTHFHPSSDYELVEWQRRIRGRRRRYLFSFAGVPRPFRRDSIRNEIIQQCLASKSLCKWLDCNSEPNKCDNPIEVMNVFQDSVFCLQPPGDSYTRRSAFDSIVAGCIPVFFHPISAYVQYLWYFPKEYSKYSVFIPENLVKHGNISINETLLQFSQHRIMEMRQEVVKLIPKIIYIDRRKEYEGEIHEDAFDIAVERVLERINKVRKEIKKGKDPSIGFAQGNSWKAKLSGTEQEHVWDEFLW